MYIHPDLGAELDLPESRDFATQPDPPPGAALTPSIVFENLQAFQRTFALKAAIELDVFRAVGQGPGDVVTIARHAKASERGIRILCDYLVIAGLLQKEDGRRRATPTRSVNSRRSIAGPALAP